MVLGSCASLPRDIGVQPFTAVQRRGPLVESSVTKKKKKIPIFFGFQYDLNRHDNWFDNLLYLIG